MSMKDAGQRLPSGVSCGDLGPIVIRSSTVDESGSCNFCDHSALWKEVNVVSGSHLEVRICNNCLRTLAIHAQELELDLNQE